jgi:glycosyltransferase involved in cell wall biosynthesis
MHPIRLALVSNFREEASPSMLVCSDRLYSSLQAEQPDFATTKIQPAYTDRLQRLTRLNQPDLISRKVRNLTGGLNKMLNRYWDYPKYLRPQVEQFDLFHICDQSYASLVHHLPAERTGMFCHDLDVFRSVLQPDLYPRSIRYNSMQRYALSGLRQAAVVFYTTRIVREEILSYELVQPEKLVQVPLGVDPCFSPNGQHSGMISLIQARLGHQPFLLNVSGNLARKRLDVLLETYAELRQTLPNLHLVRVGPDWSADLQTHIDQLGIREGICLFQNLEQEALAELYRQAAAVLVTSESEGFGMPLIEALACGTMLVVSDIPVFREVAGNAAVYCPVGTPSIWAKTIAHLLHHPEAAPDRTQRLQQVKRYTWSAHAQTIASAYRERLSPRVYQTQTRAVTSHPISPGGRNSEVYYL